ncbi:cytochrome-c oxidase, cbb3-type subunit III [Alloalcanivorax venustensis]|uniref:cytochrome-c oxidase, cbb3-type subunit III n=1 Tax=Alloalcanivorax venustensis TaxID=172371 RepID=UPI00351384F7
MSDFWSVYIIAIVVLNLVGCAFLLFANLRMTPEETRSDTTGHSFDGIQERNQPLPRWWLYLFVLTLLFSVVYLVLYPGLGRFGGLLSWSSVGQWQEEVDWVEKQTAPLFEQFAKVPIEELHAYPETRDVGGRLFANNCALCHGSDARGAKGYPNLTDDDWLYGGSADAILTSIRDGRHGQMPPMAAAVGGTDQAVRDMALYVQSLSRPSMTDQPEVAASVARAEPRFAVCAACHVQDARGNQALGAPNLTDGIWLHGARLEDIETTIREGRSGRMPPHESVLSEERLHVLAAYVYGLSQP